MSFEKSEEKGFSLAATVLCLGLLLSQAIATLHVYLSNLALHEKTLQIIGSGYVSVPNAKTLPLLQQFSPAFYGGVFFTLTVGCFLTLAAFSYAWIWKVFISNKKRFLAPGLILWAACLWLLNSGGFQIMVSAYFIVIPPVVFAFTVHLMKMNPHPPDKRRGVILFAPFLLLAISGFYQLDQRIFIHFRDNVLLSNPVGMKINDFYYQYTLYPAETFKSFDQKLLRTCNLKNIPYGIDGKKLEKTLRRYDCLPVTGKNPDVSLAILKNNLVFSFEGKQILKTDRRAFLANPAKYLKEYSQKTDSFVFFRSFILISLLIGLPVTVYVLVFGCIQYGFSRVMKGKAAAIGSSVFCLAAGVAIMMLLQGGKKAMEEKDVAGMIVSNNQMERTRAIIKVIALKQDILTYPVSETHMESSFIPERYWLALALGNSRNPEAMKLLVRLAGDPRVNVRCKAYSALGRSRNRAIIPLIYDKLAKSGHVYEQIYAYRALRDLGWMQGR